MASSYTLGVHFEHFITSLTESGRYASASEVVRAGLRLLEQQETEAEAKMSALKAAIQAGLDSGPAKDFDAEAIIAKGKRQSSAA